MVAEWKMPQIDASLMSLDCLETDRRYVRRLACCGCRALPPFLRNGDKALPMIAL